MLVRFPEAILILLRIKIDSYTFSKSVRKNKFCMFKKKSVIKVLDFFSNIQKSIGKNINFFLAHFPKSVLIFLFTLAPSYMRVLEEYFL